MNRLLWESDAGGIVGARHYGDGDGGTEVGEKGVEGEGGGSGVCGRIVAVFFAVCGFFGEEGVVLFRF